MNRDDLIKRAGVISTAAGLAGKGAKEILKGTDTILRAGTKGAGKVMDTTVDILNTANSGKVKTFRENVLDFKKKDKGLLQKYLNKSHNKAVDEKIKTFDKMKPAQQRDYIAANYGTEKAEQYGKLLKNRSVARGGILLAGGGSAAAYAHKKHKQTQANIEAYNRYLNQIRSQRRSYVE